MKTLKTINKLRFVILGSVLAIALGFYPFGKSDDASRKDEVIMGLVYNILNTNHFNPKLINDEFSLQVYNNFLSNLDYNKRFFTQKDLKQLAQYRLKLDNQFKSADYQFLEDAIALYTKRFNHMQSFAESTLSKPFDFTISENYQTDSEQLEYVANEQALKERWRKYLKYRVMNRVEDKMETQEKAEEKKDTSYTSKTLAEMEAQAREKEWEMQKEYFENLGDMERIDWVGLFVNSFAGVYDPHTQYFPPRQKEDFEIRMTGQLEGIGAQLTEKGDYVTVSKIIVGSACWKQGELEVGDKIVKVAQADEEPLDVVGMKVRNVVKYIRGPKGTEVRLTVKKMDGSKKVIPIVRDVVELSATFAKSTVLGEGDNKVGFIRLPQFYVNFYKDNNRNCAEDVKKELEKLKEEGVNSVILDLRSNGGGSLRGAIDIAGHFIDKGPVVQVKAPGRRPMVLKDEAKGTVFDKPLVVMVNNYSASASEIFAAAIKDHNRGLIVGSETTFGKGTVQNVLDMDEAVNKGYADVKPLGALKYTMQKYYRINGGTPQLRGVHSDIVLPDNLSYIEYGEKDRDYAMPFDEIDPAEYELWPDTAQFAQAKRNAANRINADTHFQLMDEYAQWLGEQQNITEVTLNLQAYHQEQEKYRTRSERYDNMNKADTALVVTANAADAALQEESEEKKEVADNWHKNLSKDIYVREAFEVATDLAK